MPCASFGVSQVLVGLDRVGVVGLRRAFERAEESQLDDPERLLDLLMAALAADNFIPEPTAGEYRRAIWREYLRHRGEQFDEFLSRVPVTVAGAPGVERDRLVERLTAALARHELEPVIAFRCAETGRLEVLIGEHTVIDGGVTRERLELAIRQSLSDW